MNDTMKKNPMFAFRNSGKLVAVIQAKSKKQARSRTKLVSHLVKIPGDCKVKIIKRGKPCRAPIFFEDHLSSIEQAIEDGLAEA